MARCLKQRSMDHDSYSDDYIRGIFKACRSFAIVGASANPIRPSYFVQKYLLQKDFAVFPVNPGRAGKDILGQNVYEYLSSIPEQIDIVDIFRSSEAALEITKQAIGIGAKVVWMQLGVRNDAAAIVAEAAGLKVVMNRCPKIEYARLSGEIGWAGVNSRVISSARPKLGPRGFQHLVLRDN